jgi:TonB-linked SusC/RagA family outer membrane protein
MRIKLLLTFAVLICGFSTVFAQNQKVTLSSPVTLKTAFAEIEKQTGFNIAYNEAQIDVNHTVTVNVNNESLENALKAVLKDTRCTFKIQDRKIVIVSDPAQTPQKYSGKITDKNNEGLIGATVHVKGTQTRTVTDVDGNFAIEALPGQILSISYISYDNRDVRLGDRTDLQILLTEEVKLLDEVVVIGYGAVRRGDLTGSIASVKGDDLPKTGNITVAQMLKAQVPGLSFTQTSNQPGAAVWMQIRGAAAGASPLIIVDGIPVSTMWEPETGLNFGKGDKESVLDNINPDDILDIQVLKDASATSIYGSRAAGGVILITTKRGSTDERLNVSLKSNYTTQWIAKKPEVMKPIDYMKASNDSQLERWMQNQGYYPWGTLPPKATIEEMQAAYEAAGQKWNYSADDIANFTGGTDWYDAITRQGEIQEHNLSVAGGTKMASYLVSLGHMVNKGIVKNNDYARTSGRIAFDQTFSKYVKGGISASYSQINSDDVPFSGPNSSTTLFMAARKYDPTIPVRDENGNFALGKIYGLSQNPASILEAQMKTKKDNLLTSAYLDIMPIDGLTVKTTVGYDRKFATVGAYFPMTTQEGLNGGGVAKIVDNNLSNYYLNIVATYNWKFAEAHDLSLMAGWEYQTTENESLSGENRGFPYDGVKWHNLELGTYEKPIVASGRSTAQNASFISRLNYSFKGRYILTANFRRDGSSNFAANKQWGNFGGVSVAWRINEESFLKNNLAWLSNLKMRAGAGVTGYAGSLTGTQTYYRPGSDYYFNNKLTSGVRLALLGNPDLSWESQRDYNIGLDFGFFNNKLGGNIDVYKRSIYDRIGEKNLMSFHEINKLNYNTERIDNTKGVDLSLYGNLVIDRNFSWRSQFTFTYYRDYCSQRDPSEILDINSPARNADWNDVWSYVADGLIMPGEVIPHMPGAQPGSIKIKDMNGYLYDTDGKIVRDADGRPQYLGEPDGKLDNADLVIIHNKTPMPFSWSNTFTYKNFDINVYMYGKFNVYKNTDYLVNIAYGPYEGTNTNPYFADRFTWNNTTAKVPAFTQNTSSQWGYADYFMENAWFVRLDNITLGYTLPKNLTRTFSRSVRLYGSVKNILTLTPYKGYDPEYDVYMYPSTAGFTFGLDIKF